MIVWPVVICLDSFFCHTQEPFIKICWKSGPIRWCRILSKLIFVVLTALMIIIYIVVIIFSILAIPHIRHTEYSLEEFSRTIGDIADSLSPINDCFSFFCYLLILTFHSIFLPLQILVKQKRIPYLLLSV